MWDSWLIDNIVSTNNTEYRKKWMLLYSFLLIDKNRNMRPTCRKRFARRPPLSCQLAYFAK